mgnify:CR=1 FL=1
MCAGRGALCLLGLGCFFVVALGKEAYSSRVGTILEEGGRRRGGDDGSEEKWYATITRARSKRGSERATTQQQQMNQQPATELITVGAG